MVAAVIFYEYAITLDSEVRLIWRRKITGASVIFFLNRSLLVLQNALTVASFWPFSTPVRSSISLHDTLFMHAPVSRVLVNTGRRE